jgi:hypothetical protein
VRKTLARSKDLLAFDCIRSVRSILAGCQYERERNLCDHQPIALAESGDAVDDAKDGGVGADPERQGQDSNCGETRMLSERATGVDKIGSF